MKKTQIKKIRKKLNLTQNQFADLLGTGIRTVARWESGDSKPGPQKRQNLNLLYDGINDKKQLKLIKSVINNASMKNDFKNILNIILKAIGAIGAIASFGIMGKLLAEYFKEDD
ncbi:MAG: helix-turn-helix domain-containing protein [Candidatus Marinimicrobia bacterium]|nr:helix-turn-helix domain-containing protein [Candidatus Neomarinimicrobiota bacterium]